jgi:hypothetical protein
MAEVGGRLAGASTGGAAPLDAPLAPDIDSHLLPAGGDSGTVDAGSTGWRFGPVIGGTERRQLAAAFNGGFKLDVGAGGFESYGRVGSPLSDGLGSIVTLRGRVDRHRQLAPGRSRARKASRLRSPEPAPADRRRPPGRQPRMPDVLGATLHGVIAPARSALGITADGHLVWAGGENLTIQDLADALLGAKVVRAVELDINPEWVAAYVYGHRGGNGQLAPAPIVPGQPGVPGEFLAPYSRDFFTIMAR